MPRSSAEELDTRIQVSLVTKIRHAGSAYEAAAANTASAAYENYVAALENLAEYITAKWRGARAFQDIAVAGQAIGNRRFARVIPFARQVDDHRAAVPCDLDYERTAG